MKIRATLWLCLILVSIIILTYRAMQGAGSVVAIVPTELVSHIHGKGVDPESVRIYIGIITAFDHFGARSILREVYSHFQIPNGDNVTVRFVLGLPKDTDRGLMRMMLWEQERFKDLQILHQAENMNEGKSYEYFADLGRTYPADDPQERPWDYAMKADDDTLINIPQLLERLRPLTPREDLYMGRGTDRWHMGAGYLLSWDLVCWLRDNPNAEWMNWNEDQAIGEMLQAGGKGHNFINLKEQVMDHPAGQETDWTRPFGDDVILVHRLKDVWLQGDAIEYFFGNPKNY